MPENLLDYLSEANQQFALMAEFKNNNGSRELRCERPKMK